mgnify:CR=1 FL=1
MRFRSTIAGALLGGMAGAAEYEKAQFVVRVKATQVFPNCPRYVHRMQLVERSKFVPREDCRTPVPGWKRAPWARDHLPAHDPARST